MGNLIKETPYSEITATLEILDKLGLTRKHLTRLRAEPGYAKHVVKFMLYSSIRSSVSQKRAREIMDKNFFGIEEAIQYFGVKPTQAQLLALNEIPFTEAELRECKDSHILVAVFPMSIFNIYDKVARQLFYEHEKDWYDTQVFMKDRGETAWYLVRKDSVPNSISKRWNEQQALLVKNEETPTAQVMVYMIIGHFLATGERLFENICVRCSDVDLKGRRVHINRFDSSGLDFEYNCDAFLFNYVGVASARKPVCPTDELST